MARNVEKIAEKNRTTEDILITFKGKRSPSRFTQIHNTRLNTCNNVNRGN